MQVVNIVKEMAVGSEQEKRRQQSFLWQRSSEFPDYNSILAFFQAQSVLENAHGNSLLDLACGDGTITAMLSAKFKRVVGVDASTSHLIKAKERCPKAEFKESLIETLETGERFDVITMLNILEHVIDPVLALQRAASFLREDGILIVHVPNALAVNRVIARIMGTLTDEYELSPYDIDVAGHRRSYDMRSLAHDFRSAGLEVISTGGIFYKMLSTPQMDWLLRNGPWADGSFGWGRVGAEKEKDWKFEFCRACYEFGKTRPDDCNVIYACAKKK